MQPPAKRCRVEHGADEVANRVLEVARGGKVVAGIVAGSRCVSAATGGKWFPGNGPAHIKDGHAEVLARRGFLAALQFDPSIASEPLHMYVSRPPCGDCAIYVKADGSTAFTGAKLFDFRREGEQVLNATRLKAGRSDNKHKATSLSCSDKLIRWHICGLQGSKLFQGRRIRLASLTVGCSPDEEEGVRESLRRLNERILHYSTLLEVEEVPRLVARTTRTRPESGDDSTTNWFLGCDGVETIVNGRLQGSTLKRPKPSRLSTERLFSNQDRNEDERSSTLTRLLRAYEPP